MGSRSERERETGTDSERERRRQMLRLGQKVRSSKGITIKKDKNDDWVCVFWATMVARNGGLGSEMGEDFGKEGKWIESGVKKPHSPQRCREQRIMHFKSGSLCLAVCSPVRPVPFFCHRLPSCHPFLRPINLTKFQLFVRSMLNERLPIANAGC